METRAHAVNLSTDGVAGNGTLSPAFREDHTQPHIVQAKQGHGRRLTGCGIQRHLVQDKMHGSRQSPTCLYRQKLAMKPDALQLSAATWLLAAAQNQATNHL